MHGASLDVDSLSPGLQPSLERHGVAAVHKVCHGGPELIAPQPIDAALDVHVVAGLLAQPSPALTTGFSCHQPERLKRITHRETGVGHGPSHV